MRLRWEQRFLAEELAYDQKDAEIVAPPSPSSVPRGSGETKMIIFQVCQDLEKFGRALSSLNVLYRVPWKQELGY